MCAASGWTAGGLGRAGATCCQADWLGAGGGRWCGVEEGAMRPIGELVLGDCDEVSAPAQATEFETEELFEPLFDEELEVERGDAGE